MREMILSMTCEIMRVLRLDFWTIEKVDLIKYILVVNPAATRCMMSCCVWGSHDWRSVFHIIAIVLCMHSHRIRLWILVVETSLIPKTWRRWTKAYPIMLPQYNGQLVSILGIELVRFVQCNKFYYIGFSVNACQCMEFTIMSSDIAVYGEMRSSATFHHDVLLRSCSGNNPIPLARDFCILTLSQWILSTCSLMSRW